MSNDPIGLGVFGTFGNPNGYQHTFFLNSRFLKDLDLNPNIFEIYPNTELFAVKKDLNNDFYSLCFCIYSFAKEYQSDRRGAFIGNCILMTNCNSKGEYIYECLRELHTDTISNSKNISNNRIQVLSSAEMIIPSPHTLNKLNLELETLNNTLRISDSNTECFVAANPKHGDNLNSLVSFFFEKAVKDFPHLSTLYFSSNPEIIQDVKSKKLIQFIEWEDFKRLTNVKANKKKNPHLTEKHIAKKEPSSVKNSTNEHYKPSDFIFKEWYLSKTLWDENEILNRIEEHNRLVRQYDKLERDLIILRCLIEEEGLNNKFGFFLISNKVAWLFFATMLLLLSTIFILLFQNALG